MNELAAIKKIVFVDELGRHTQMDLDADFDLAAWLNEQRAVVAEVEAWAETLAAKLNADAGVTDTDYDAVITATTPAALA